MKCTQMKKACTELLFFIVKYANFWHSCECHGKPSQITVNLNDKVHFADQMTKSPKRLTIHT